MRKTKKEGTLLFVWGTLTTKIKGVGRDYFDNGQSKIPECTDTIEGISGEIYRISERERKLLDAFERPWGYIPVLLRDSKGRIVTTYVRSPRYDVNYWKNLIPLIGRFDKLGA